MTVWQEKVPRKSREEESVIPLPATFVPSVEDNDEVGARLFIFANRCNEVCSDFGSDLSASPAANVLPETPTEPPSIYYSPSV